MADSEPGAPRASKFAHHDWIVLPLLCVLTIFLMLFVTQGIAKRLFTESRPFIPACMGPNDPLVGAWAHPNSACREKKYESGWIDYRFNSCGHRSELECATKRAGTYRIVMVGSSVAMGHVVQREKTFAALLPIELAGRTKRDIELYNEGMITVHPHALARRMNEVLSADPDIVLWALTPGDIEEELLARDPLQQMKTMKEQGWLTKIRLRWNDAFASKSAFDAIHDLWDFWRKRLYVNVSDTAAGTLLLHYLYESKSQYVKSYLAGGDEAGFLNLERSADWQVRLKHFDEDAAQIEAKVREAGIPLVAVLIPNRAQAAIISMGRWPDGVDPYLLDRDIGDIVRRHGGLYLDILPEFSNLPDAERYYFPVDTHPNVDGHAIISQFLAQALTGGEVGELTLRD